MKIILNIFNSTNKLKSHLNHILYEDDITIMQFLILHELSSNKTVNLTQLCDSLLCSPPEITNITSRMQKKQLITKTKNIDNRRCVDVKATKYGNSIYKKYKDRIEFFNTQIQINKLLNENEL